MELTNALSQTARLDIVSDCPQEVPNLSLSRWADQNTSVFSWSASFYPQPILNWQRKSTHGLAIDFPAINVLGFACYTISTATFLWSPLIREQYAARHEFSPEPTVRFNDFAFALHAVMITALTYSQFFTRLWKFKVGQFQRVSRPVAGIFWGGIISVLLVALIVAFKSRDGGRDPAGWAWIDVVRRHE